MGKYYIHETARLLGVSDQALRFFEKKGIITARRDEKGYRCYDENDIGRLLGYQNSRSCGFNMEESLRLMDSRDEIFVADMMENKILSLEKKIRHMEATMEYLREQQERLRESAYHGVVLKGEMRPRLYVIRAQSGGTRAWLDAMPIVRPAMLLPLNHRDNLDLDILYVLEEAACGRYGLEELAQAQDAQVWPAQLCLRGMFRLKRGAEGDKGVIQTYLDEHGITRTGPVLFYPVYSARKFDEDRQEVSCVEAWIPVESMSALNAFENST